MRSRRSRVCMFWWRSRESGFGTHASGAGSSTLDARTTCGGGCGSTAECRRELEGRNGHGLIAHVMSTLLPSMPATVSRFPARERRRRASNRNCCLASLLSFAPFPLQMAQPRGVACARFIGRMSNTRATPPVRPVTALRAQGPRLPGPRVTRNIRWTWKAVAQGDKGHGW